jgi:mercuric ion binding protein
MIRRRARCRYFSATGTFAFSTLFFDLSLPATTFAVLWCTYYCYQFLKSTYMKLFLILMLSFLSVTTYAQKASTSTFAVSGNCALCKKHIEKAVAVDGVNKASWNQKTQKMTVEFDPSRINVDAIQQKIAAAGYDTEKYRSDDKAYKALDECCQYERKKGK